MRKTIDPQPGQRLRHARKALGLSQEAFAEQSDIPRSTIAGIESFKRAAGRDLLIKLAGFLAVPLDYFTSHDDLVATALWLLSRLPRDELELHVQLLTARATRDKLPPRD